MPNPKGCGCKIEHPARRRFPDCSKTPNSQIPCLLTHIPRNRTHVCNRQDVQRHTFENIHPASSTRRHENCWNHRVPGGYYHNGQFHGPLYMRTAFWRRSAIISDVSWVQWCGINCHNGILCREEINGTFIAERRILPVSHSLIRLAKYEQRYHPLRIVLATWQSHDIISGPASWAGLQHLVGI